MAQDKKYKNQKSIFNSFLQLTTVSRHFNFLLAQRFLFMALYQRTLPKALPIATARFLSLYLSCSISPNFSLPPPPLTPNLWYGNRLQTYLCMQVKTRSISIKIRVKTDIVKVIFITVINDYALYIIWNTYFI